MRISDWSSDVCSSDLATRTGAAPTCCCARLVRGEQARAGAPGRGLLALSAVLRRSWSRLRAGRRARTTRLRISTISAEKAMCRLKRSEEHTSELQSLMRNSYAVFCLKKKKNQTITNNTEQTL